MFKHDFYIVELKVFGVVGSGYKTRQAWGCEVTWTSGSLALIICNGSLRVIWLSQKNRKKALS